MRERGHDLRITARRKEVAVDLLEAYGLPYAVISSQRPGSVALATELMARTWRLGRVIQGFRPDALTGIMGPSIALAGAILRVPSVVFYDTEFATQTNRFVYPLAHTVCTPDCYQGRVRGRHVTYPGYHELAYLHPDRFQPDPAVLLRFGVDPGTPYSLVRFVHWKAIHDRRERGLTPERKRELVDRLERHGRVLLSSEGPLPPDLEPRRVAGPVAAIHHLIAHARVIVGESATMSSEAAVLGVPAVFIATTGRGYTDEQELRYGLVRHFTEHRFEEALEATESLAATGAPADIAAGRRRLLEEKIDVTAWMVDFFERRF
jgi:predicted glycosyltransferase